MTENSAPLISVIIPAWNRAIYLGEALESVFAQTFTDYEVIVVDDGSTDGTRGMLEPYIARIRYLHQDHKGVPTARNLGVEQARGKYIAFLDSDDLWESTFLSKTLEAFQKYPEARLVTTDFRILTGDGSVICERAGKRSPGPFFTTRSLLTNDWRQVGMPMLHRESLLSAGKFDPALVEAGSDMHMWLRLSLRFPMAHVPDTLQIHRWHGKNLGSDQWAYTKKDFEALSKFAYENPEVFFENSKVLLRNLYRVWRQLLQRMPVAPTLKESLWLALARPLYGWTVLGNRWPATKRDFAYHYHLKAYQHLLAGCHCEARKSLKRAILCHPLFMKNYLYWLFTYFPPSVYAVARRCKRLVGS